MNRIDLIYDRDCPNVGPARENLRRALSAAGLPQRWREWDGSAPDTPAELRRHGSPAVVVDGRDVGGVDTEGAASCRIYRTADGTAIGAPPVELIASALLRDEGDAPAATGRPWRGALAVGAAIGVSFLPKLACPACWPAYASILTPLGLGFLASGTYLRPLTLAFLVLAVGIIGVQAVRRRRYSAAVLGLLGAMAVFGGKFHLDSAPMLFVGVGLLMAGSLWNQWPRRRRAARPCSACACGARELRPKHDERRT